MAMRPQAETSVPGWSCQGRIPRLIFNDDSESLRMVPTPHSVASLALALDYLKGTPVDCLCWCLGSPLEAYSWPSQVIDSIFDLVAKGARLNDIGLEPEQDVLYTLYRQGIDYVPLLVRRAHEQGMLFVGSFRMNDTHHKSYPDSAVNPSVWKEHQDWRIWDATDAKSYHNAAFDYSIPDVRQRLRDAVAEVIALYDLDGIELDFTRGPYYFNPSEAWRKRDILTQLVREIGALLEQAGTRRGRPFVLILRAPCGERLLRTGGIDLRRWIAERLAPVLILSAMVNDYDLALAPWRRRCHAAGVLLYPAVEAVPTTNCEPEVISPWVRNPLAPRHDGAVRCTPDEATRMWRAAAQNLLAQEPDGLATFNLPRSTAAATALLQDLGGIEALSGKDKRYTFYRDLPIYVEAARPRRYHQTIPFTLRGNDLRDAAVTLRWHWVPEKNPHIVGSFRHHPTVKPGLVKVYLNGREIAAKDLRKTRAPAGRLPSGFLLKSHQAVEVTVPGSELRNGRNTLAFEMPKFPERRDPYVYIYDLTAEVAFGRDAG
jgi:hypothetical protein